MMRENKLRRILREGSWDEISDGSVPRIAQFLNMLR